MCDPLSICVLNVLTPTSGDVATAGDTVMFTATVSDEEDIASDVALSWVSDIDGEFSTQGSNTTASSFSLPVPSYTDSTTQMSQSLLQNNVPMATNPNLI